jgi:hypothetical protein
MTDVSDVVHPECTLDVKLRVDSEEKTVMDKIKKLISAMSPSAQRFRASGKGSPGRGGGPRLTDRKHFK